MRLAAVLQCNEQVDCETCNGAFFKLPYDCFPVWPKPGMLLLTNDILTGVMEQPASVDMHVIGMSHRNIWLHSSYGSTEIDKTLWKVLPEEGTIVTVTHDGNTWRPLELKLEGTLEERLLQAIDLAYPHDKIRPGLVTSYVKGQWYASIARYKPRSGAKIVVCKSMEAKYTDALLGLLKQWNSPMARKV